MTLTAQQVTRVFQLLFGCPPRTADLEIVSKVLGGTVDALADYLWDHIFGEPADPNWHQVRILVKTIVENPDLSDDVVLDAAAWAMAELAE
jgi:hypothetical protein